MLVLSRKRDESILIGDDITITVTEIRGDKVRLGIAAPRSIVVHRREVAEAIAAEQRRLRGDAASGTHPATPLEPDRRLPDA